MAEDVKTSLPQESPPLEEVNLEGEGSGLEAEKGEGAISAPFDPALIDVITQGRTVDLLIARLREGELDLSPEFQRRSNLWNQDLKSSLIESMLLRIPIPSLYVSEDKEGNYTVVDGLQRICAIAHFVEVSALNKAVKLKLDPLRLSNLQSLAEYKDKSFVELPRALQRRIKETELTLHVIRASTPADVKFNIFSRINRGGLPLTAQEIRNAVFRGQWRERVRRLAEGEEFRRATEGKIKGQRMEDIELVLRFVAHYSHPEKRPDDQNLDQFLNETVQKYSVTWSDEKWTEIESAFLRGLQYAPKVFGRIAFRKYFDEDEYRLPINRGLFESETVAVSRFREGELKVLAQKTPQVIREFELAYLNNYEFRGSLLYATGRGRAANKRAEVISGILQKVLHA